MRIGLFAVVLGLATAFAVPAFAEGNGNGKHFPMPAAEFKAKVDARMTKARARMEEKAKSLPADQAKELRTRFEAGVAKVNAEVAKAVADGTVTKEEAKAVRQASPHHGKHARHAHGKGKGKGKGGAGK